MIPIVLALETSTPQGIIALGLSDGQILCSGPEISRQHACTLVPAIQKLLDTAGLKLDQVEAIAVGLGPGSFTGLRVGLTVAKTLSYATGARLIGLPSLEVIACNLRNPLKKPVVVADAQRGEWYVARYQQAGPEPTGRPIATRPLSIEPVQRVIETLDPDEVLLGPSIDRLRSRAELPAGVAVCEPGRDYPEAEPLVRLARVALLAGVFENPMSLEPIYVRKSAAEEKADQAVPETQPPGR